MRFTLTYQGPLHGGRSGDPVSRKAHIRSKFHPQLAQLWTQEPLSNVKYADKFESDANGHTFRSLVHSTFKLRADLDLLLLTPAPPGHFASADIDNRLKTLFDALRAPSNNELPKDWQPVDPASPTYCLMEDDRLITRLNMEVGQLLALPPHTSRSYVELVLHVTVYAVSPTWGSVIIG